MKVRLSGVRTFLLLVSAAAEGGILPASVYAIHPFPGIICLTQTVTQTGTGADRKQRRQQSGQQVILSQKGRKGRESPFFPPPTHLHTQEVTGSSPVVSTKKFLISQEIRNFYLFYASKNFLQNLAFAPTNTLTNTAIVPHRTGQHRARKPRCILPSQVFEVILKSDKII